MNFPSLNKLITAAIVLLQLVSFNKKPEWTASEIRAANTAGLIDYLSVEEKKTILFINLARLYPQKFEEVELSGYDLPEKYRGLKINAQYFQSLKLHLSKMQPCAALSFDDALYRSAKCFSAESGKSGATGHARIYCPKLQYAECCSYGMTNGLDITMQWLIDDGVESLGHRLNCLNADFTKVGVSIAPHSKYEVCAVADFIW